MIKNRQFMGYSSFPNALPPADLDRSDPDSVRRASRRRAIHCGIPATRRQCDGIRIADIRRFRQRDLGLRRGGLRYAAHGDELKAKGSAFEKPAYQEAADLAGQNERFAELSTGRAAPRFTGARGTALAAALKSGESRGRVRESAGLLWFAARHTAKALGEAGMTDRGAATPRYCIYLASDAIRLPLSGLAGCPVVVLDPVR
jgi:hypothetical protein